MNIGGLIAIRDDEECTSSARRPSCRTKEFPTYGGMAGRDMEALAVGLAEAQGQAYLDHRIGQVGGALRQPVARAGVPVQQTERRTRGIY